MNQKNLYCFGLIFLAVLFFMVSCNFDNDIQPFGLDTELVRTGQAPIA